MPEDPVGPPVLRQLHGRPYKVSFVLFELLVEAIEKREGIRSGARKSDDHLVMVEAPDLSGAVLHDRRIECHLTVPGNGDLPPMPHGKNGRSPDLHPSALPSSGPRVGAVINYHQPAHADRRVFLRC